MAVVLGPNQYGKAETRVVRIYRDTARHEIRDLNVSTTLRGDFAAAHVRGDQARVLPTDSQKNTCFAFASEPGVAQLEEYALALARHFADDIEPVSSARVEVEEYAWERVTVAGAGHPHTFVRSGQDIRTAAVTVAGRGPAQRAWVVSGLKDLVVLKSTGSEFTGFLTDQYTTLPETRDRSLATSLSAHWRYAGEPGGSGASGGSGESAGSVGPEGSDGPGGSGESAGSVGPEGSDGPGGSGESAGSVGSEGSDEAGGSGESGRPGGPGVTSGSWGPAGGWDAAYGQIRQLLLERFAQVHSLALQQTLWEMGRAVLEAHPDVAEIRLSAPNKHHFLADLSPFGLSNPGEVFYASDRPYGLIQCTVHRDEAADPGPAWDSPATFG
jgi:urate oxidase